MDGSPSIMKDRAVLHGWIPFHLDIPRGSPANPSQWTSWSLRGTLGCLLHHHRWSERGASEDKLLPRLHLAGVLVLHLAVLDVDEDAPALLELSEEELLAE